MAQLLPLRTAPDDFSPDPITDAEAAAMFRAAVKLFGHWGVTDAQAAVLLDLPVRTYARWKSGEAAPPEPRRQGTAFEPDGNSQGPAYRLQREAAGLRVDQEAERGI